jgi:hypothetical protein
MQTTRTQDENRFPLGFRNIFLRFTPHVEAKTLFVIADHASFATDARASK